MTTEGYFSSGGIGDSLICLVKILQEENKLDYWHHISSNRRYVEPISQIMFLAKINRFESQHYHRKIEHTPADYQKRIENQRNVKFKNINTKIIEMQNPFLKNH